MKIYIMRHGEAATTNQSQEQVLTAKGQAGIEYLATRLKNDDLHLAQVFHSGKKRAEQTAGIILKAVCPEISASVIDNIKPGDNPEAILPVINDWDEDTLIVSHLPFIPNLITLLSGTDSHLSSINYVPGTLICLKKNTSIWNIQWVLAP